MYKKKKEGNCLRSAAFVTTFVCNLVHTYKFQGNLETASGPYIRLTGFYHPNRDDDDDDPADHSASLYHFSIVPGAF